MQLIYSLSVETDTDMMPTRIKMYQIQFMHNLAIDQLKVYNINKLIRIQILPLFFLEVHVSLRAAPLKCNQYSKGQH